MSERREMQVPCITERGEIVEQAYAIKPAPWSELSKQLGFKKDDCIDFYSLFGFMTSYSSYDKVVHVIHALGEFYEDDFVFSCGWDMTKKQNSNRVSFLVPYLKIAFNVEKNPQMNIFKIRRNFILDIDRFSYEIRTRRYMHVINDYMGNVYYTVGTFLGVKIPLVGQAIKMIHEITRSITDVDGAGADIRIGKDGDRIEIPNEKLRQIAIFDALNSNICRWDYFANIKDDNTTWFIDK
jgi:hypothetical protein